MSIVNNGLTTIKQNRGTGAAAASVWFIKRLVGRPAVALGILWRYPQVNGSSVDQLRRELLWVFALIYGYRISETTELEQFWVAWKNELIRPRHDAEFLTEHFAVFVPQNPQIGVSVLLNKNSSITKFLLV